MLFSAISCYLVLFSVIYYILLGLTEIIKFLFGHFPAVNIYSYIMKKKMKAIPFKHAWWNAVVFKRWLSFCFHILAGWLFHQFYQVTSVNWNFWNLAWLRLSGISAPRVSANRFMLLADNFILRSSFHGKVGNGHLAQILA